MNQVLPLFMTQHFKETMASYDGFSLPISFNYIHLSDTDQSVVIIDRPSTIMVAISDSYPTSSISNHMVNTCAAMFNEGSGIDLCEHERVNWVTASELDGGTFETQRGADGILLNRHIANPAAGYF